MIRRNWTREELIMAFNLYCKIPFGQYNQRNKKVIELSEIIQRTPGAVAFKLVNFASLDPYHQKRGIKGMKNSGKLDKEIYLEFSNNWDDLIFESEMLLSKNSKKDYSEEIIHKELKIGTDITKSVKIRVNQSFFRKVILSTYSNKCAVSNIDLPELLIASHIIPWSQNKKERLNPSNGICLSPLYDKVFDRGLMTLSDNYEIIFSKELLKISDESTYEKFFYLYENKQINLPEKFFPEHKFLEYHRNNIFRT